ncbi:glycosyltransferase family 2 protein [Herbiconiux sp. KACC 21604]|uniref:glycosyltransferase family 2 protein n=1 Tax=unclassified Herbiconiux TaxID=2618217 RepID=UPI0014932301|nr:glycosyltransferase family 2 protein [Herbiconiux sp. SALV-R1]QJU54432.1 glycosyltransferase family 2 protein [Herbiconiux sp. SALV-R1]WPO85508.1 glycosyltransferase family 2 protein [Herbiconiux sp. KACC 21604]
MTPPPPATDPATDPQGAHAPGARQTGTLAVVTVSYASESVLPGFLGSIEQATAAHPLVVVADNKPGAVGPSPAASLAEQHGATYVPLPANPGYGGGMNAAVAALPASVEWVLISNPDIVLHPGALDLLVATGASAADIGSVGPQVLTDGVTYPSARSVPSLRNGIGHALFARVWPENPWTKRYHAGSPEAGAADVGWLSGSCLLVRRTAFEQLGGFDESYFMYFEDVDLGYRLGKAGWRNRYEPAAVVEHSGGHSTVNESAVMIAAHHKSAYRFLSQKYRGPLLFPLRLALRAGLAVRTRLETRGKRA